jgi:hypothetical protein
MQEYKITVEIQPDGQIKAEISGIEGPQCIEELSKVLKDLGYPVDIKKKPEFFQVVKTGSKVFVSGGGKQ